MVAAPETPEGQAYVEAGTFLKLRVTLDRPLVPARDKVYYSEKVGRARLWCALLRGGGVTACSSPLPVYSWP